MLFTNPVVAFFFQFQRQIGPTGFNDAAAQHDMHIIRFDVIQDALVMVDHNLPCSEGAPRISGLLTGKTYDGILNSFVGLVKESGYIVVDKMMGKRRSILIGVPR